MTAHAGKLICVVGATGNQGGSVARRFLAAGFRVRGLTRSLSSPAAQALTAAGAEMVVADLADPASLETAFRGANVIFSVTNFWEPFFRPDCREAAKEKGIDCRRYAYEVEYAQGKNIADAAATAVDTLDENGFLVSTLSHAAKCSGGKYKDLYHYDAKADIFPDYVNDKYPALSAKMSSIHTGYFYTSYNILPNSYFGKADGTFEMTFTTTPDKVQPHLDPVGDMGNFTYAVYQMPPGKAYMAAGTKCTWPDFLATWGRINSVPVRYRQVEPEEMIAATPDYEAGVEVSLMFSYSSDPGYDGAMDLLYAEDLIKAGIDCPMTTWEEWASKNDWTKVLNP
ncbi:hypothetical protein B0I35DRAFT_359044 [Stachybotrys elegans]|uniref:NmrA-like domain-containing protein n=1 Tax=Stachybotrys elegans TaxID=80388 RepID=A0A8K0SH20_9HYPO|nr:hypothetical protein B0I35DRAFT_359044 [Stachybotrys elegans]